jgi:NAD(P)H-hydrate epimerase
MWLPAENSHKGQNGKLLIIGGSDLFHAASRWSLDVASKFVDMVFYSSIPSNNDLVLEAKGKFWNGIVVERDDLESYLTEADCILIGPGMTRVPETEKLINKLLQKHSDKRWVIDAGALQMVDVRLLNQNCIITPHKQEFLQLITRVEAMLIEQYGVTSPQDPNVITVELVGNHWTLNYDAILHKTAWFWKEEEGQDLTTLEKQFKLVSEVLHGATVLRKGPHDVVMQQDHFVEVLGGNSGMTKGGTGDVLAGLIAALYCKNDALTAATLGSYFNKKAGDDLYLQVGPNFNSSDLVEQIPKTIWREKQSTHD